MNGPFLERVILLVAISLTANDEATLPNGARVSGKLDGDKGSILFANDAGKTWTLDQLQQIRFAKTPCPPPRVPLSHRLLLSSDQWLSGELLAIDGDFVHFRTWMGKDLKVPRKKLFAIAQPADWRLLSRESFENEPAGWTFTHADALRADAPFTGKKSLILDRPNQEAVWSIARPLTTGRLSLFLRPGGGLQGQELRIESIFHKGKQSRAVRLKHDGAKFSAVKQAGLSLAAAAGWHLLQVDFGGPTLRLSVDGFVLHTEPAMAGSMLSELKLTAAATDPAKPAAGFWSVDDVQVLRLEPDLPWPSPLPDADALWLPEGDQVFGKIARGDATTLTLEASFGTRTFTWPTLHGVIFKADGPPAKGAMIDDAFTLWVAPSPGFPADRIAGKLLSLSNESLVLRNETLGELSFDRKNCEKLVRRPSR